MNRQIGVVLSYVLMIFEVLSTLLLTPFILSTLGQAEYGIYRLSGTIVSYLLLLDLGVSNASIRFLSKYRANNDVEQSKKFFGVALIYYFAVALIALIIGIVLLILYPDIFAKGFTDSEIVLGQKLLFVTILTAVITLITSPFSSGIIAYEKFGISKGTSIISTVLKIIFTFIGLKLGFGSLCIVVINLVLTFINRVFYVVYVLIKLKLIPKFKNINFSFIKEIVVYSSFILLQMIATQINVGMGQVLLGALVSSSAVIIGVYSVGTQIIQYYQSIGSSVNGVLMPGVVKFIESKPEPEKICEEMIRIGRLIMMVLLLIFIGFFLYGKQFIVLWAGVENIKAYNVALILMIAYMFILIESIGNQILWAMNFHKEQAIVKVVIVFVNLLLTIYLIKLDALFGATFGTFVSLIVGDIVLMNIIFKKKINISLSMYYKGLFKGIVPCALLTLLIGGLFSFLSLSGWLGFACNVLVVTVTYIVSLFLIGMNTYEKNLASGILSKLIRRK